MENQPNSELDFELEFFEVLTGSLENLEILPIPDFDGITLTVSEIEEIKKKCDEAGLRLFYKVGHGKVATIFNRNTKMTGIVPEGNSEGFDC
jgi:hypothetical protein